MSTPREWAQGRIARMRERSPLALDLARLASPAVFIEPELLRALRREALPAAPASVEAEIWFSALVASRSAAGITLEPAVTELLREELAAEWAIEDRRSRLARGRSAMEHVHRTLSPALALEEKVAWLAVEGDSAAIEAEIERALKAIASGSRPGLIDWAAQAWERLPPLAQATRAGWLLRQAAGAAERPQRLRAVGAPVRKGEYDLGIALAALPQVRLGVRRVGTVLELGEVAPTDAVAILVPDTEPRVLDLEWSENGTPREEEVAVPVGGAETFEVGEGQVRIRTLAGSVYAIGRIERPAPQAEDAPAPAADVEANRVREACCWCQWRSEITVGVFIADDLVLTASPGADQKRGRNAPRLKEGARVFRREPDGVFSSAAAEIEADSGRLCRLRLRKPSSTSHPMRVSNYEENAVEAGARWMGCAADGKELHAITGQVVRLPGTEPPLHDRLALRVEGPDGVLARLHEGSVVLHGSPVVVEGSIAGLAHVPQEQPAFRMPEAHAWMIDANELMTFVMERDRRVGVARLLLEIRFDETSLQFRAVVEGQQIATIAQSVPREELERLIDTLGRNPGEDYGSGVRLGELLVPDALRSELAGCEELVIGLDSTTAGYPWELLAIDPDPAQPPIAIRAGMIRQLVEARVSEAFASSEEPIEPVALVIGAPGKVPQAVPGAHAEAERVAEALGSHGFRVHVSIQEPAEKVMYALSETRYRVLHFAGLGITDSRSPPGVLPPVVGLLLGEGLAVRAREFFQLPRMPELVFVSCSHRGSIETWAQTEEDPGWASLPMGLIDRGVRAVIVTALRVDDYAGRTFTERFYDALTRGASLIEAVRDARRATFERHPKVNTWAAFQCWGDPDWRLATELP